MIKNKNIIITGTSTGIGKKLATNLLKKNNYVWGCSRTNSVINHKNYKHYKIDLENFESLSNWIGKIKKDTREKVDLLICNAAVFNRSLNLHETKKNILKTINVNLSSNIILSKLVSDIMVKRKNGLIIFFSSVATKINQEGSSSYSASKSGIETFSQVLSKESIYNFNRYNNPLPNIDTAYKNSKKFIIPDWFDEYEKLFNETL